MRAIAAVAICLVFAAHARAQETPEEKTPAEKTPERPREMDLEAVIVSATRREGTLFESPFSAARIDLEEIQRQRIRRTTTDALLDEASVMVQKTAYGQASPFIRGFTGYQTVMMVDGIRLNNSTFRSGPNQYWSTVDLHSVEAVELVRGPGSVLYGSDAVGGAVNAVARRREEFEPGSHGNFRTLSRVSSAERSFTQRVEAEGNHGAFGVLAGVTWKNFGDLHAGSGELPGTGYREGDADLRLDFETANRIDWTLGIQHVRQWNVPRTETTVDAVPFHGTAPGTELKRDLDQERDLVYLRGARDGFTATLSWHRQGEEQDRDRTGGRTDIQGYTVHTLGLQVQQVAETSWGTLTGGIEWWRDSVESYGKTYLNGVQTVEAIQGPVADDAGYDLAGAYLQDEIPLGGGVLVPAARFTYAAARAGQVDDPATPGVPVDFRDSWTNTVGSLRTVQPLGADVNAFGGVSQAFRAPNLSDLTRLDDTSGVETPTLDLEPEEFVTAEAGVRVMRQTWSFQGSLWRTWIDGLIVASPTGNVIGTTPEVRKDNVGDGWVHGVDLEASVQPSEAWRVTGAFTWMKGEVDQLTPAGVEVREPLSRVMPVTGTVTVAYAPPGSPWSAWVSGRAAGEQDRLSLKDATDTRRIPPGGTPGYAVLSLGAGWEVSKHVRVALALENLFNKDFRIHGSGVNEPGRNLVGSLELSF